MKRGGVLFRDSSSLADTGIEKERRKKKNISNERNPLFAARQEFEEHDGSARRGGNCSYTERSTLPEVRCFLEKIGIGKSDAFRLAR